jgi:geranylgeranyl transferase type-2 subunit beta
MLQVARLAPRLLGDSAGLVLDFLRGQMNDDGGFKDRSGASDLYYTVFGIEGLLALRGELPAAKIESYLKTFGGGESLDLVHASCLARCWAALPAELRARAPREAILRRVEQFRSADGAYSATEGAASGTLYGCFMAAGAHQDAGAELPDAGAVVRCIQRLRAADGGYANGDDLPMGLTPPSAGAATLLRNLGEAAPAELGEWLLARHHKEGGFFATPLAPIPDLLSTATALHALAGMQVDLGPVKEPCLDFVDSLWTNRGAFYGNWTEDVTDCEYTYYGLLALGHLSL